MSTNGIQFRWRWDGGTISTNLDVIWGMSVEILFEAVIPTVWDNAKIEGIDLDSDFFWIESDPDPECLAILKRRGLENRLLIYKQPNDLWKFACRLEPLGEQTEMW